MDILALCDRFHCLPSALFDEDAELLRYLELEALVREARGDGPLTPEEIDAIGTTY